MNLYKSNCESMESFLNLKPAETSSNETARNQERNGCSACHEEESCAAQANRVSLKCGTPLSTNIPETAEAGTVFNVANVNIDTGKYRDPCIRFEFAGNLVTEPGTVTLNFQILKQCKYQAATFPVGPVWTFSRADAAAGQSDVFMFAVCDCDVCESECCNYSVVATVEVLDTEGPVVINNAALNVLVVDHPHCG